MISCIRNWVVTVVIIVVCVTYFMLLCMLVYMSQRSIKLDIEASLYVEVTNNLVIQYYRLVKYKVCVLPDSGRANCHVTLPRTYVF